MIALIILPGVKPHDLFPAISSFSLSVRPARRTSGVSIHAQEQSVLRPGRNVKDYHHIFLTKRGRSPTLASSPSDYVDKSTVAANE